MRNILILTLFIGSIFNGMAKQTEKLEYFISFPNPETHYAEVKIKVSNFKSDFLDFKMPVWAPGSYLVREFAKSVEGFEAGNLTVERKDKNTWRVNTKGKTSLEVSYKLYGFEKSVRTTFIDLDHAFLHNSSCFMYIDQLKEKSGFLLIEPYKEWKKISTSLNGENGYYGFDNYDELADSPIEIGNHDLYIFDVNGVPHTLAMVGRSNCDIPKFLKDLQRICEETTKIIGEHPCKSYLFIVHNVSSGGGGLEHLNSTCVQMNRFDYDNPGRYLNFLGLCAHEYFHLWNVKRLRPVALGPFDYDKENYTHMLWVAEGITNYYDELIPARAGFINDNTFLSNLAGRINAVENRKGNQVQSLASASWNAWIKAYRPNENSMNTTVSYYTKGLVVAAMLDILITKETKGEQHLDDLMQALYQKFYVSKDMGFTDQEFVQEVNKICGSDQSLFFNEFVFSTAPIDYNRFFTMVGLKLVDTNKKDKVKLGASLNKTTITYVETGSGAYVAGLNVNDEILAIDGIRVNSKNINDILNMFAGKTVPFLISRDHLIRTISVEVKYNQDVMYILEKLENGSSEQKKLYEKWMQSVL